MTVELKGRLLRVRVRDPKLFKKFSFRTHDLGKKGGTKRVAAKLKKGGNFVTQGWTFKVKAIKQRRASTIKILAKVAETLGIEDKAKIIKLVKKLLKRK